MSRRVVRSETYVSEFTCNRCEKTFANEEIEEALHYEASAGYNSNTAIGDGTLWSIDLCQYCVVDLLGPYIQKHDSWTTREVWTQKGVDAPAKPVGTWTCNGIEVSPEDAREMAWEFATHSGREGLGSPGV